MFTFAHFLLAIPPAVKGLTIQKGKTSVVLTWKKPEDGKLNIGELKYSIECDHCKNSNVSYSPAKTNFTSTSVNVSGLLPKQLYTFRVISMNSLINVTWKFVIKNVMLSGQYRVHML